MNGDESSQPFVLFRNSNISKVPVINAYAVSACVAYLKIAKPFASASHGVGVP